MLYGRQSGVGGVDEGLVAFDADESSAEFLAYDGAGADARKRVEDDVAGGGACLDEPFHEFLWFLDGVESFPADEFFGFVGELFDVTPDVAWVLSIVVELSLWEFAVRDAGDALAAESVFKFDELVDSDCVQVERLRSWSFSEVADDVVVVGVVDSSLG